MSAAGDRLQDTARQAALALLGVSHGYNAATPRSHRAATSTNATGSHRGRGLASPSGCRDATAPVPDDLDTEPLKEFVD